MGNVLFAMLRYTPQYFEELRGLADGAGIAFRDAFLLNTHQAFGPLRAAFDPNGGLGFTIKLHGNDPSSIFTNTVRTIVPTALGVRLFGERGIGAGRDAWLGLISNSGLPMTWTTLGGVNDDAPLGLRVIPFGMIAWGSTRSLDALGSGTGSDQWLLHTSVDGVLHFKPSTGFTSTNEKVDWGFPTGNLVFATQLAPSVQAATMTVTDKPMPFVATTATETVLSE